MILLHGCKRKQEIWLEFFFTSCRKIILCIVFLLLFMYIRVIKFNEIVAHEIIPTLVLMSMIILGFFLGPDHISF